ncbi:MAG: hypothetical protein AAFY76_12825, partial [Cyanobacteria bacterium J06649_11]
MTKLDHIYIVLIFCLFSGILSGQSTVTVTYLGGPVGTIHTWTKDNLYVLDGIVNLYQGRKLVIEPGTVIKAKLPTEGESYAALVISDGAEIQANGTAAEPIIFTVETDNLFDDEEFIYDDETWHGIQIYGRAPMNPYGTQVQYTIPGTNLTYSVGGNDVNDSSGSLSYVSIRHAGADSSNIADIGGLTLVGVGAGTVLNHIEIYEPSEFTLQVIGGTAQVNRLVSSGGFGVQLRDGFRGSGQFWFLENDFTSALRIRGPFGNGNSILTDPDLANLSIFRAFSDPNLDIDSTYRTCIELLGRAKGRIDNSLFSATGSRVISMYEFYQGTSH